MERESFQSLLLRPLALLLTIFSTVVSLAAPMDPEHFLIQQGGFVDIPDGAYVQGSSSYGGIQPDYRIDLNEPDLKTFLDSVRTAARKSAKLRELQKAGMLEEERSATIELVTALIQKALPHREYDSAPYLKTLEEHRAENLDITLGSYLQCRAGVCRESSLLTHFALKAVGIPNHYVYVKAAYREQIEDHAIVVVTDARGRWVVDPYNELFHGRDFDGLIRTRGAGQRRLNIASFAGEAVPGVKILQVLGYPKYWIPQSPVETDAALKQFKAARELPAHFGNLKRAYRFWFPTKASDQTAPDSCESLF